MDPRTIYLKVKIKSLAEESRIIRQQERVWKRHDDIRNGLREHRTTDVRRESRYSLLAYAFIRGKAYLTHEHPNSTKPDIARVSKLAAKFSRLPADVARAQVEAWINEPAKLHPEPAGVVSEAA